MSLINQMLRDLEQRRKREKDGCDLHSKTESKPVANAAQSKRTLLLAAGWLLLVPLVWLGLEFFPVERDRQKDPVQNEPIVQRSEVEKQAASLLDKQTSNADAIADLPAQAGVQTAATAQAPVRIEPVLVQEKTRSASGINVATLLTLGILESTGSARMMLEFEQLPEYQVMQKGPEGKLLAIQFKGTSLRPQLEIPALNGPLLKEVSLLEKGRDLSLAVQLGRSVGLQKLELPADTFHGPRLLIELHELKRKKATSSVAKQLEATQEDGAKSPQATDPKVRKKSDALSAKQLAERLYQAGLELLHNGDRLAAEESFAQALNVHPQLLDPRRQLIGLLQQQQKDNAVEKQLLLGLQYHPDDPEFRKGYARSLLTKQEFYGALDVLLSKPMPSLQEDLEYFALLAALHQEVGQHEASSRVYARLLEARPGETLWWLGMAIALEQSGKLQQARQAYRKALEYPGLRLDLADYVRERLQAL